jgi:hypothetical protein
MSFFLGVGRNLKGIDPMGDQVIDIGIIIKLDLQEMKREGDALIELRLGSSCGLF